MGGAVVPPFTPSPLSIRLFFGSVKTDRPVEKSLTRADVVLFSQIRNQNWTCAGCCNFFSIAAEKLLFRVFFFFFFFFFFLSFCDPVFLWLGSFSVSEIFCVPVVIHVRTAWNLCPEAAVHGLCSNEQTSSPCQNVLVIPRRTTFRFFSSVGKHGSMWPVARVPYQALCGHLIF